MRNRVLVLVVAIITILSLLTMSGCGNTETANDEATSTVATKVEASEKTTEATTEETTSSTTETTAKATQKNTEQKKTKSANKTKATTKATQANTKAAKSVCYVSVDGYCTNKEISLSSGDNAYTVLKKTGASVSARNTSFGLYVEGINQRYEFDEGETSGWKYSVNGSYPNHSCDKQKINKGDVVKWVYVH